MAHGSSGLAHLFRLLGLNAHLPYHSCKHPHLLTEPVNFLLPLPSLTQTALEATSGIQTSFQGNPIELVNGLSNIQDPTPIT